MKCPVCSGTGQYQNVDEDGMLVSVMACPGCGGAMVVREALKVLVKNTVVYMPASCLLIFSDMYPFNAFRVPSLQVLFETSAICASGIKREGLAVLRHGLARSTQVS